jgi:hypothetical protein
MEYVGSDFPGAMIELKRPNGELLNIHAINRGLWGT